MDISPEEKKKIIKDLEALAKNVLNLKNESIARRPIVIEFCGSPKSGKSSCINSLELFLRRNGFRTRLLTERASVCPIKSKFDPFFNVWTVTSALAELVEILSNHSKDYDVIVMDRGIFDGLCWFRFLMSRDHLDSDNFKSLESFLLMNRFLAVIDLVYIFTASSEVSLEREYATLLTDKTGSIMKPSVLNSFRESILNTAEHYKDNYQRIETFDTSTKKLNQVSYEVTKNILEILKENIEEKIGYFKLSELDKNLDESFHFNSAGLSDIFLDYGPRQEVEQNGDLIQPIPILVVKESIGDKVLVVRKNRKRTSKGSPESGKTLLYLGGHIRSEDMYHSKRKDFLSIAKLALSREIKEEIGVDFHPSEENIDPMCIWVRDNERSKKHLAICFIFDADFDSLKFRLDKSEFVTSSNSKSGKVLGLDKLLSEKTEFEAWSQIIVDKIFKKRIPKQDSLI